MARRGHTLPNRVGRNARLAACAVSYRQRCGQSRDRAGRSFLVALESSGLKIRGLKMAKQIDRTQEDKNQDNRIDALERSVGELSKKIDADIALLGSHTSLIAKHEQDINALNPLKA